MNIRLNDTEESISDLEGNGNHPIRTADRKTNLKNENSLGDFWGNIKYINILIVDVSEG